VPIRRYAPALIVAVALLLVVIIAPSKGPSTSPAALANSDATQIPAGTGLTPDGVTPTESATAAPGKKGHNGGTPAPGSTESASNPTGIAHPPAGDRSHCVGSYQFAVPGFQAAPPCQATFTGNNGGATFKGVTADKIEIVYYQAKTNLALQAILGPAGLSPTATQVSDYINRATQFINSRYELWGRKIHVDYFVSGSCAASPPSDACFRQDAQTIVAKYHPFAVLFPRNITAPGFNAALSHLGVVNLGGMNMPLSFSAGQAPYHYDYDMDGDTQAQLAGEWYCKELANRKAIYAGEADLRGKPRAAEVLTEDTPEHVETAQRLAAIINHCDHGGGATVKTYSPDTSQAVVQSTTLASQAKQNGITTILYSSDPIFPVYLTPQMTNQNYFPENVVIGSGYLDFDGLGQLYDKQQWKNAFGLGDLPDMAALSHYDSGAVYRSTKGSQAPFTSAANIQGFFSVLASGLQQAGPTLNPTNFERGVLTLPAEGGSRYHSLIKFGAGDFTGVSDARIMFWDPSRRSPTNGKPGTYVALNSGHRYTLGDFPTRTFTIPGRG
jgi:hypothetical protein